MKRKNSTNQERLFSLKDISAIGKLVAGLFVVWVVPERYWHSLSRAVIRVVSCFDRQKTKAKERLIKVVLGTRTTEDPGRLVLENAVLKYLSKLQILKVHHPQGYEPEINLVGQENITAAEAEGRGVILWMGAFVSASLIEPMALKRAGIPLHHLSNWLHGLSRTRFAVKWLNPMVTAAENHYLAERIVRRPGFADSLVTLRKRLGDNKVVGVRASDGARIVLDVPFLSGRLSLATGPLELALLTGAKILPMFVVETEPNVFDVHVGVEISLARDGERKEAIARAAREYAGRLEPYVVAYPDRWTGWDSQARLARADDGDEALEVPGMENSQWRAFRRLGS